MQNNTQNILSEIWKQKVRNSIQSVLIIVIRKIYVSWSINDLKNKNCNCENYGQTKNVIIFVTNIFFITIEYNYYKTYNLSVNIWVVKIMVEQNIISYQNL